MKRSVKLLAGVAAVALSAMVSMSAQAETLRLPQPCQKQTTPKPTL